MNLKQKLTQTLTQKKADSDLLSQISTLKFQSLRLKNLLIQPDIINYPK